MLRAGLIATAFVLVAQSASAQQTGFYGGTAQERRFAKAFYEDHKEEGIEYVSVSFRLMTLTIYPSEPLYKSWLSSDATARINIMGYCEEYLEQLKERFKNRAIKLSVKVRYPNSRQAYEQMIGEMTWAPGSEEPEFTFIKK